MRIRLKGINSVKKTLADGSVKVFYYAWKSGPPLRGEPGTPEFIASYNEAVARKLVVPNGALLSLLQRYQASSDFTDLADSTRRSYIALIKRIEKKFSDFPLSALTDRRTRGIFKDWRDTIAAVSGRRQADYTWTVLARVFSFGLDRRIITTNPCERGGRLYKAKRNEKIWTDDDEARFFRHAPAHLHLALLLGLWTGQRQGDLLRLAWSSYDGSHIRLRQSKTDVRVSIPVGAPLKAALDEMTKTKHGPLILTSTDKKPWTSDGFRTSWRKACRKAGVVGVTFNDLRGTAVTRLALAGCTEAEIATITGHSLRDVRSILDAHYLHRDPALAESAIRKLERRTNSPN
jgi:integrase